MSLPLPAALHHTSFVVRDVEGTAQKLSDALGIGPWNVWTISPEYCRVHGENTPFAFRIALATVGGGTYELVAPFNGRSVLDEHLDHHGEGFHHTCLVYATLEEVRGAMRELRAQGRQPIQEAGGGDRFHFAYFLFPEIGSLIELLFIDPAALSAPEAVIRPASASTS
jgi:hypothetical protein